MITFFELIDVVEICDKRTFHSCVCRIVDARAGDHGCDYSLFLIRCSTYRTLVVKSLSIFFIDFMSLSSKDCVSIFYWIVFALFMVSFLIINLRRYFLYTVAPLGLDVDNSLEDMSFIVYSEYFNYNFHCRYMYGPR